jgi:membrane protein YqaA with SNARE-associated domain
MLQATKPHALPILAGISFIESSVFPIPPDVLMIPLILAQRDRAFFIAGVCTVASVAGGFFGYFIGYALFETIGAAILNFYGYLEKFSEFQHLYNENGLLIVFFGGITPSPTR